MDVNVQQLKDGSLATSVYRKPTHTNRYFQYSSHYPVNQKVSVARTLFSRDNRITSNKEKMIEEFYHIIKTLRNNGFPSSKFNFKKYLENHTIIRTKELKRFTSISYMQNVSYLVSRLLTQVGIGVALERHHTLSLVFRKPRDVIYFDKNVVWCIKFLAGIAMLYM